MEFKVNTPNNNFKVEVFSKFICKEDIRVNKEVFTEMCKKCKNYGKKYSCPPKSPNFNSLCSKEGLFIVLMKINLSQLNTNEYNKIQLANSVLKSRIDKLMRLLEKEFNTKYLSSGSCRLCKPCNLQKNLPCRHPSEMRFSLEATGIDCNHLAESLFGFPLLWYKEKRAPEYTCVLAGLLCNKNDKEKIQLELEKCLIK